jgi:hypothetical protein
MRDPMRFNRRMVQVTCTTGSDPFNPFRVEHRQSVRDDPEADEVCALEFAFSLTSSHASISLLPSMNARWSEGGPNIEGLPTRAINARPWP